MVNFLDCCLEELEIIVGCPLPEVIVFDRDYYDNYLYGDQDLFIAIELRTPNPPWEFIYKLGILCGLSDEESRQAADDILPLLLQEVNFDWNT